MVRIIKHWEVGPPRATTWRRGLPMPGHRDMAQVMAEEQLLAISQGAVAFTGKLSHPVGDSNKPVGEGNKWD